MYTVNLLLAPPTSLYKFYVVLYYLCVKYLSEKSVLQNRKLDFGINLPTISSNISKSSFYSFYILFFFCIFEVRNGLY